MTGGPQWFVADIVIVATIVASAFFAAWRGIIRSLFGLLACVLALAAALLLTTHVAALLPFLRNYPLLSTLVSFVLLFVGVLILAGIPGGLLHRLLRSSGMGFVDRSLGFVFGVLRGLVIVLAVLWLIEIVPGFKAALAREPSYLLPFFAQAIDVMRPWFAGEWTAALPAMRK